MSKDNIIKSSKHNKHLTLDERNTIHNIIGTHRNRDGSLSITLKEIGLMMEKDPSTISKEIKKHRKFNFDEKCTKDKIAYRFCARCHKNSNCCKKSELKNKIYPVKVYPREACKDFESIPCIHLTKFPWVCNGCPKSFNCPKRKSYYSPKSSQEEYESVLKTSREGLNMEDNDFDIMNTIIKDGVDKGQSIDVIVNNNLNKIKVCTRSIYRYINDGILYAKRIDTRRMARFKIRKIHKITPIILRKQKIGHSYDDFTNFIKENPSSIYCEMDTVIGKRDENDCVLTLYWPQLHTQMYFKLEKHDSASVVEKLNNIVDVIGIDDYKKTLGIILTDNGSEFSDIQGMTYYDISGEEKSKIYFCDPNRSDQKGACERNHELFRYIVPKGQSLSSLTQDKLDLIMSHVNSYKRKSTDYSTPLELFCAYFGEEILNKLNIKKINPNNIILTKDLLKI